MFFLNDVCLLAASFFFVPVANSAVTLSIFDPYLVLNQLKHWKLFPKCMRVCLKVFDHKQLRKGVILMAE